MVKKRMLSLCVIILGFISANVSAQPMIHELSAQDYFAAQLKEANDKSRDDQLNKISYRVAAIERFPSAIKRFKEEGIDCTPIYNALVSFLEKDLYPNARAAAAEILAYLKDNRAIVPLKKALKDKSIYVQLKAASALAKMGCGDEIDVQNVLGDIALGKKIDKLSMQELMDAGLDYDELTIKTSKYGDGVTAKKYYFKLEAITCLSKSNTKYAKTIIENLKNGNDVHVKEIINNIK